MSKTTKWVKQPQQQPQTDASEMEKITIGDQEIEVSKALAEHLRGQGRTQATQAFTQKALKVKPDEMDIGDKTKPGKILEQAFGLIDTLNNRIAEMEAKTKTKKDSEPEELKQAKLELAAQANEIKEAKAKLHRDFAVEQAMANVFSSGKRDFNLTEESEGLYPSMVKGLFDFEVESDGAEGFSVTFNKKGEGFPFMPEGKPPTSKQLAELIAKAHPGNHGNGVSQGLNSRRTASPGAGSDKPLNEQKLKELEAAWDD